MRTALSAASALLALAVLVFFMALEAAVGTVEQHALPDYAEYGPPDVTVDECRYWSGQAFTNQGYVEVCDE